MAASTGQNVAGAPPPETFNTVTQLANELGITPRAIRFYEDKGLIAPRRAGTTRIYTHRDRVRMVLILRGKRLGFSLREIREYLDLYNADRTHAEQQRVLLKAVRARIARLEDQRAALEQTLAEAREIETHTLTALEHHEGERHAAAD